MTKYAKNITVDGYNIRLYRCRSWLEDADFQIFNAQQTRYDIFMSNKYDLSVFAFAVPFDNPFLDETKFNEQFLFRHDFNRTIYYSRCGVTKVYCTIEDVLSSIKYLKFIIIWLQLFLILIIQYKEQ